MANKRVTVVTDKQNRLVGVGDIEPKKLRKWAAEGHTIRYVTLARFKKMKFKWQTENKIFNDCPETPF